MRIADCGSRNDHTQPHRPFGLIIPQSAIRNPHFFFFSSHLTFYFQQMSRFLRRLFSAVAMWLIALFVIFSANELFFLLLVGSLGLAGLWEYFGMIEKSGMRCFKAFGMICGAAYFIGSFVFFHLNRSGSAYDFETVVLVIFLFGVFARQMFRPTVKQAPLETMAYTLFGILYVAWLFNFLTKIVYVTPRTSSGATTGQFYVLYLVVVTKFSDMGGYLVGSRIGRHQMMPHISAAKTWEGFAGSLFLRFVGSYLLLVIMPGSPGPVELFSCNYSGSLDWGCGRRWRPRRIDRETKYRRQRFRERTSWYWRNYGSDRQFVVYWAVALFLSQIRGPMRKRRVILLGSTGSIGTSAIKVAQSIPDRMEIVGMAARQNAAALAESANRLRPPHLCLVDPAQLPDLHNRLNYRPEIFTGEDGLEALARTEGADLVLVAIIGTAGFYPAMGAIETGKDLAVASKEILVMAGEIVMQRAREKGVRVLPVDSEHNAIFQCLEGKPGHHISNLILTASGGPFRTWPAEKLASSHA